MPLTAYTCYRFLCFCCKTRLEFSVLLRTDSATCDINSCRVSSEGSSFDVSRYSLIPISFIIAHKIKLSLINIQIFSENLLPYLPALFFSGHKNTLFMTWKNTHGLLWKIQAIYFEISALYFKISALYFSLFQMAEKQCLAKAAKIPVKKLWKCPFFAPRSMPGGATALWCLANGLRLSACGIKNENIGTDGGGFPAAIMLRESFLPHFLFPGANVRD